jgi:hypothetical protein
MWMLQPGDDVDLAEEAVWPERMGQLGMEHFDRDRAVVSEILGEIDRSHPAAPEFALDRVAVAEGVRE